MADIVDGWWFANDAYLTEEHRQDNALKVYYNFRGYGWSFNAICAMLGNMEVESSINPGLIEGRKTTLDPDSDGYGLTQWSPASKLLDWAEGLGLDYRSGNVQCYRIDRESLNNYQWIENYNMSFVEYRVSTRDIDYLTRVFGANYERPTKPDWDSRIANSYKWRDYILANAKGLPVWLLFKFKKKEGR